MNASDSSRDALRQDQPLYYAFPAPAGAVWLGLGPAALLSTGLTVAAAVLALVAGAPLAVVAPSAAAAVACCLVNVLGRPLLAWSPLLLLHAGNKLCSRDRQVLPLHDTLRRLGPGRGAAPEPLLAGGGERGAAQLRIGPHRLQLVALTEQSALSRDAATRDVPSVYTGRPAAPDLAAIRSRHGRTLTPEFTIVLDVVGTGGFGLLDAHAQDTDVARWGSSLTALYANPAVQSVQWVTQTRPHQQIAARRPGADSSRVPRAAAPTPGSPATQGRTPLPYERDQDALQRQLAEGAVTHRHLLAVTVDRGSWTRTQGTVRARRPSASGTARHDDDDAAHQAAQEVAAALLAADLLSSPLSARDLARHLGRLLDPTGLNGTHGEPEGCEPESDKPKDGEPDDAEQEDGEPGPADRTWLVMPLASARDGWDSCRTDDTFHRCYALVGLPRLPLTADWFGLLLHAALPPGTSRTLSVHTRPVAPDQAIRRARAASAKARLDATDRSRLGFTEPERGHVGDTLAEADAHATEAELTAGHRLTDLSMVIAISGTDLDALDRGCRQLRTDAATSRLSLRPLHGQHLTALASVMPLGLHPGASS